MLAIQTPSPSALITPARRDSPRPAATVRSASGPRPNTRRPPSGTPTTSPAGVLTRAAGDVACPTAIAFLSCLPVLGLLEQVAREERRGRHSSRDGHSRAHHGTTRIP